MIYHVELLCYARDAIGVLEMTNTPSKTLSCPFHRCRFTFLDDETLVKELVYHFKARHTRRTYNMLAEKIAQDLQNDFIMSCRECKNKVMIKNGYGVCEECETKYGPVSEVIPKERIEQRIKELESQYEDDCYVSYNAAKIAELKALLPKESINITEPNTVIQNKHIYSDENGIHMEKR